MSKSLEKARIKVQFDHELDVYYLYVEDRYREALQRVISELVQSGLLYYAGTADDGRPAVRLNAICDDPNFPSAGDIDGRCGFLAGYLKGTASSHLV